MGGTTQTTKKMPTGHHKVSAARCILRYTLRLQMKHLGTHCAICLDLIYSGLSDGAMLACRHLLHLSCVTRYALSESRDCRRVCMLRCPICRAGSVVLCRRGVLFPRWVIYRWKVGPLVQHRFGHLWLLRAIRDRQRAVAEHAGDRWLCKNSGNTQVAFLRAHALAQALAASLQSTCCLQFKVHSKANASAIDEERRWSPWWDIGGTDDVGPHRVVRYLMHGLLNNHCLVLVRVRTLMQSAFKRQLRSIQGVLQANGLDFCLRSIAVFTYSSRGRLQATHFRWVGLGEPCCFEFSLAIPSTLRIPQCARD